MPHAIKRCNMSDVIRLGHQIKVKLTYVWSRCY